MNVSVVCPACESGRCVVLWRTSAFELRFCPACQLRWASRMDANCDSPSYGRAYFERNYLGDASHHQKSFFKDELMRMGPHSSARRVLDIGFGAGFFLEEALKQGWAVTGIESSQDSMARARRTLGERATLISGDLRTVPLASESFDLITFWDVIAHVADPRGYLLCACALLRPGGLLVIKTPFRPPAFFKGLAYLPAWVRASLLHWPWQTFYFSEVTLRRALESAGFHEIESQISPELPSQSLPWSQYFKHPKGAALAGFQWLYNRLTGTRSLLLYARK